MELNLEEAKAYVSDKFVKQGEYDFLDEATLNKMLDTLLDMDSAYMDTLGDDGDYDEDAVFDAMHERMMKDYPSYKMYMMRFVEDYMDFMDEYLDSIGAIEWV